MPSARLTSLALLVLIATRISAQQPARRGSVEVLVALVADELQVRPVPLYGLELLLKSDTTVRTPLRTGLDGRVSSPVASGTYALRSVAPAILGGLTFRWVVPVVVERGKTTHIELSNANAQIDSVPVSPVTTSRQIAPEIAVYERVKRAVVRIDADLVHGTGFLLDTLGGLVVTNEHVVDRAEQVSVVLDSATRVRAQVVAQDHDADLALLRFDLALCGGCPRLHLAQPDSTGATVVPGERVIAIGFPLNQQSTVTSGIVSGVRERAIISDVNINHGNSGGPLLNTAGDVVAINTFGDFSQNGGPGVSGSIIASRLAPLLSRAADTLPRVSVPEGRLLPVLRGPAYTLSLVRSIADTADINAYEKFSELRYGDFQLTTTTNLSQWIALKQHENEVAHDRRARERRAGLSEEQRYTEFAQYHDWGEYVGDFSVPAVVIDVHPRVGEKGSSLFGRVFSAALTGYAGRAKLEFKGDVQGVRWYRDGEPVIPAIGGRGPQSVYENNQWLEMKDVAYRGLYVFPPSVFAPDSTGAPPSIVLQIDDLKHWDRMLLRELPAELVARIWNDFGPYYAAVHPDQRFVVADPAKFVSDFQQHCIESDLCSGAKALERGRQ